MCRSQSIKVCTVAVVALIVVSITAPVESVTYRVFFEPTKVLTQCKNTKYPPVQTWFDFSKLDMRVADDNTLLVTGTFSRIADLPDATPTSLTTTKMKSRGRWVDMPYSMLQKDMCASFLQEGKWWTEHITQYFVGDERLCPPKKYLELPVNVSLNLDIEAPTPVPTGEYMSRTVFTIGDEQVCFEMNVDLTQAPR